jgi:anti-anti-sigma factor
MHIHEDQQDDILIFRLSGRLDAMTAPVVEEHVKKAIESGPKKLAFDCAKVEYLSSAGLRVLLSTSKKMQAAGGKFIAFSLAPSVKSIIEMAGFDKVVTLVDTEHEALES